MTMKRIEPTLGSLDLTIDPAEQERAILRARKRRFRSAVVSWSVVFLLTATLLGGALAAAISGGALVYPDDFQWVNLPGKLVVVGFALAFLTQIVAAILAFRVSFLAGALSLLVPGYLFFCLRRQGDFWPLAAVWLLGLAMVTTGTMLLS
jgi:hypothetical protein